MFDTTQDDINPSFTSDNKKFPQPTFLQRSVSAPAIAEHVSEAILPAFKFEVEEDPSVNLNFSYANNPSRMNPRMPNAAKKGGNMEESESAFSHIFTDSAKPPTLTLLSENLSEPGSLSASLMFSDPQSRTAMMDLIQADFPATPSSIYSNRLLNADSRFDKETTSELKVMSITDDNNGYGRATGASILPTNATDSPARLNALVNGGMPQLLPSDSSVTQTQTASALLSQIQLHNTPNVQAAPFFPPSSPAPTTNKGFVTNANTSSEPILPFPSNANAVNSVLNATSLPHVNALNDANSSHMLRNVIQTNGASGSNFLTSNANASATYNGIMGNTNASNGVAANALLPSNATNVPQLSMLAAAQGASQQNSYFMQPALYLNPNAQPVYYRTAAPNGQFGQDYTMYPAGLIDGNALQQLGAAAMMGDPNQLMTTQAQLNQAYMSFPGMQQNMMTGFWPQGTPEQQQNQLSMYQQALPNMRMNLAAVPGSVDEQSRLLYAYGNMAAAAGGLGNSLPVNRGALNVNGMNGAFPMNNVQHQSNGDINSMNFGMDDRNNNGLGNDLNNNNKDRRGGDSMNNNNNNNHRGDHSNHHNNNRNNNSNNNDRDNRNNNSNNNRNNRNNNFSGSNNNNNNNSNNNGNNNNNNNGGSINLSRDSLVEEFRSTFGKSRQWTLSDLIGHIVAFCQDQHGSRFIQQRLEVCTDSEKQLVFDEILPAAQILMTDVFGNYVLQKLFEYGTPNQCESLALLLKGQAVQLSMQMYGCRVVQKALEYVNRERLVELVSEFESPQMLIRCVHDSNGNHVIQKCIEVVSKAAKEAESPEMGKYLSSRIQFVINAFQGQVKELSSHPYGCRVVQRILEHCTDNQKAVVLEELRQCCGELVQDCYGNYVIQFVMQHGWDADRAVLIREVQSHLLDFSQHKFASNVVEKCLQYASKKDRDEMIWTIINVTFDLNNPVDSKGHCVLESMVRDPYANYVVQKVIDVSDERQRAAIMRYVKDNINQLRKYTYGKHIIVRLEKITNEKF